MRLEIINPSDRATIDCTDREAACVAILLLGNGAYGIKDGDGVEGMPFFLFGNHEEWLQKNFGKTLEQLLEEISTERLAAAFESVQLEGRRSSINDFAGRAHNYAQQLREHVKSQEVQQ